MLLNNRKNSFSKKLLKFSIFLFFIILGIGVFRLVQVSAFVPDELNFQGKLTDNNGVNVADGYYDFRVKIYNAATSGTAQVIDGSNDFINIVDVRVLNGIFNLKFSPLASALTGGDRYVQVCFNSSISASADGLTGGNDGTSVCGTASVFDKEFTPRKKLTSNPYSLLSKYLGSTNVYGGDAGSLYVTSDSTSYSGTGTVTTSGTSVTGSGTSFTTQFKAGSTITVSGQTRVVISISNNTDLSVDRNFSPDVSGQSFTYKNPSVYIEDAFGAHFTISPDAGRKVTIGHGGFSDFEMNGGSKFNILEDDPDAFVVYSPTDVANVFRIDNTSGDPQILFDEGGMGHDVGIGVANPAYTLDVNGTVSGSNLRASSMTSGSILFAGTSGIVSQSNSNLFWDNTNGRLGVGINTPTATLDIEGDLNGTPILQVIGQKPLGGENGSDIILTAGEGSDAPSFGGDGGNIYLNSGNGGTGGIDFGATGNIILNDLGIGNVGIGTNNPNARLDVVGTGSFSSSLTLGALGTASNNTAVCRNGSNQLATCSNSFLTAESDTLALVTGRGATTSTASTFSGGLTVSGSALVVSTLGTASNNTVVCRNGSNQLATCTNSFLTTEADTLATVTGRGATTSTASTFTGGLTVSGSALVVSTLGTASNNTAVCRNGSNQLATCTNSFLTSEADTLSTVTGRGATTSTASTFTGGLTVSSSNLTLSSMTSGSILFAGTSGVVSQSNSNLFWDNTNSRLGIGTSSPTSSQTKSIQISDPTSAALRVSRTNSIAADVELGVDSASLSYVGTITTTGFTIKTGNTEGLRMNTSQQVGIGTGATIASGVKLDVQGTVEIGVAAAPGTQYALCHTAGNGAQTNTQIVDCASAVTADYMEMYSVDNGISTGDVVATSSSFVTTKEGDRVSRLTKTSSQYQSNVIGIISDPSKAGDFNSIGYNINDSDNPMPVALNGRVLVKVTSENGTINPGDLLTTSSKPGVAMKATGAGFVIGKALDTYTNSDANAIGLVMVYVSPMYYNPSTTTTTTVAPTPTPQPTTVQSTNSSYWSLNNNILTTSYDVVLNTNFSAKEVSFASINSQILNIGSGKLTIDANGNLTTSGSITAAIVNANSAVINSLTVTNLSVDASATNPTTGSGTVKAGQQTVVINNTNVTTGSKIFVTITSAEGDSLRVISKVANTSFTVKLNTVSTTDVTFDYWIIGE